MSQTEFKVGQYTFRPMKLSPTQILALESIVNFDDFEKADYMYKKFLEYTEVEIAGTWQPVKQKGVDVYCPANLEEDVHTIAEICRQFLLIVVKPVFQKSTESNK